MLSIERFIFLSEINVIYIQKSTALFKTNAHVIFFLFQMMKRKKRWRLIDSSKMSRYLFKSFFYNEINIKQIFFYRFYFVTLKCFDQAPGYKTVNDLWSF